MSPINIDAYLPTDTYRAMLDQIIAAPADPGLCLRTRLTEILGAAGVWPDYCRPVAAPPPRRNPRAQAASRTTDLHSDQPREHQGSLSDATRRSDRHPAGFAPGVHR